jgi:hypothetical protein
MGDPAVVDGRNPVAQGDWQRAMAFLDAALKHRRAGRPAARIGSAREEAALSKTYAKLDEKLIAFIRRQKLFFIATAPLSARGSVNVSPKGYDSLAIIDERTLAYVDLGGSGIETHGHVRENGRITLMFCAFEGPANILRVYGCGESTTFDEAGFAEKLSLFPDFGRARAVVTVNITKVADSCGWGVPFFDYRGERDQLRRWVDDKPEDDWKARRYETNTLSIDGLPGLVKAD